MPKLLNVFYRVTRTLRTFRQLVGLAVALTFACGSLLALDWKATTVSVTTAPFQTEQEVTFEFTNRSANTVSIHDLKTSCSCLSANSDQKSYAPGAAGKITAMFTVGDRSGLYERVITVVTDEALGEKLMLKVAVPEIALVTPRSVAWRVDDEPVEKSVDLNSAEGLEIIFNSAEATNEAFLTRLQTIEVGKHYKLHLKPTDTKRSVSAAIRITGREKSGHDILLSAYASVN